jgi:hypothetical protein
MLPPLRTNGDVSAGTSPRSAFPPPRFRAIAGSVSEVKLSNNPYHTAVGITDAQRLGLRYERIVQDRIREIFPGYVAGAYIHFCDDLVYRTAQPDGLLVFDDYLFIVEIKYQHVPEAWWQLDQLYKPLAQKLWPQKEIGLLEICRIYDPATPFPCDVTLFDDLREWVSQSRKEFGVLVWR